VYGLLIAAVPITATLHARYGARVLGVLVLLIAVGSVAHRSASLTWAGWVTAALVWVFCHQLGYAWRTWELGQRPLAQRLAVVGAGLAGLTMVAGYPLSMVATSGYESNIFPTNATIAALAVFQLGLLVLVTPTAERLLRRPAVWKPVVAVNVAALTIFLWHITAYLVVVWAYEGLGGTLSAEPTAGWWAALAMAPGPLGRAGRAGRPVRPRRAGRPSAPEEGSPLSSALTVNADPD
jgi:peptidoglycan/LPS O-acetylase OafA/YrhL